LKILVLGAGRIGYTIAKDLAFENEFHVTSADISENILKEL